MKIKSNKIKLINVFLFLIVLKLNLKEFYKFIKINDMHNESNQIESYKLPYIFNLDIKNKTILIFEAHKSHYECTPGFAKYLIDFGYNVDIIMNEYGKDTFNFAEYKDKIRLMIYNSQQEIICNLFYRKYF